MSGSCKATCRKVFEFRLWRWSVSLLHINVHQSYQDSFYIVYQQFEQQWTRFSFMELKLILLAHQHLSTCDPVSITLNPVVVMHYSHFIDEIISISIALSNDKLLILLILLHFNQRLNVKNDTSNSSKPHQDIFYFLLHHPTPLFWYFYHVSVSLALIWSSADISKHKDEERDTYQDWGGCMCVDDICPLKKSLFLSLFLQQFHHQSVWGEHHCSVFDLGFSSSSSWLEPCLLSQTSYTAIDLYIRGECRASMKMSLSCVKIHFNSSQFLFLFSWTYTIWIIIIKGQSHSNCSSLQ